MINDQKVRFYNHNIRRGNRRKKTEAKKEELRNNFRAGPQVQPEVLNPKAKEMNELS